MPTSQPDRRYSKHYQARSAERHLRREVEAFLMAWGTETRAAGAMHLTIVRRDLPPELRRTCEALRADGWILVAGDDGTLLTCYRRPDAWRFLQRKSRPDPRQRPRRRA